MSICKMDLISLLKADCLVLLSRVHWVGQEVGCFTEPHALLIHSVIHSFTSINKNLPRH